jgi:hypothetical protein
VATNSPEYDRNYRRSVKPKKEREAHQEGVREGLNMAIKFLRTVIGGRALTGYQSALALDKAMVGAELPEAQERRKFIEAMR